MGGALPNRSPNRRIGRRGHAAPAGATSFEVRTNDDLTISGHRLGSGPDAVVFCHGFSGFATKPRLVPVQRVLAERFTFYAFDFRGHGRSEGACAFGADEHLDVDAVVALARRGAH